MATSGKSRKKQIWREVVQVGATALVERRMNVLCIYNPEGDLLQNLEGLYRGFFISTPQERRCLLG